MNSDILPFSEFSPFSILLDGGFFDGHLISRWFLKVAKNYMDPIRIVHYAGTEQQAREAQRAYIVSALKKEGLPLFYYPEGWDTNGTGLLRYQKFLFGMGLPVLPVALQVDVPFQLPIRPGKLGSTIFMEILWLFFTPYYHFKATFLPSMQQRGSESDIDFAKRVQIATSKVLSVPATDFGKHDALVYRKSLIGKPKQN